MNKIEVINSEERLFERRKIFLNTVIEEATASEIIPKFIYLDSVSHDPIEFYINSPGGSVTAGLAIYDIMCSISSEVSTICFGQASSMAQVLLTAGAKGKRFAYPHAQIMMHQPMGTIQGQVTDIQIQMFEIQKLKLKLSEITALHTGQPLERVLQDAERDFYFSVDDAIKYGLIDEIITLRNVPVLNDKNRNNRKSKNNKKTK
ncbi:MAG: ATP-dependent Clp protease proteolytic subunit [Ignavibacteria bacterium]